jgi:polyhydroxyalkanoate synthesis regulator phasin
MVMWKDAFEKINIELDLTKRKKQALDDLLNAGRISQSTYDCLCKDINEEINQIEARRKALAEKTASKISELEEQLQTLEFFLATTEMAYVAGEISSELYSPESNALNLGLEATKQELNWIKEVIIQLVPKEPTLPISITATVESIEATPIETAVENAPQVSSNAPIETPVEVTPASSDKPVEQPSYVAVETATEQPLESTTTTTTTESPPQQEETK